MNTWYVIVMCNINPSEKQRWYKRKYITIKLTEKIHGKKIGFVKFFASKPQIDVCRFFLYSLLFVCHCIHTHFRWRWLIFLSAILVSFHLLQKNSLLMGYANGICNYFFCKLFFCCYYWNYNWMQNVDWIYETKEKKLYYKNSSTIFHFHSLQKK